MKSFDLQGRPRRVHSSNSTIYVLIGAGPTDTFGPIFMIEPVKYIPPASFLFDENVRYDEWEMELRYIVDRA